MTSFSSMGMANGWTLMLVVACFALAQCAVLPEKYKTRLQLPAQEKTRPVNSACLELYQKNSRKRSHNRYLPVCTAKGDFLPRQCFWQSKSSRVCFCVDPLTGMEIKGTRNRLIDGLIACPSKRPKRLVYIHTGPILEWPTIPGFEFHLDDEVSSTTSSPERQKRLVIVEDEPVLSWPTIPGFDDDDDEDPKPISAPSE